MVKQHCFMKKKVRCELPISKHLLRATSVLTLCLLFLVAYAIGCAVRYNPPGEENSIPGKVLLCQTKRVEENQWGKSITAPASQKAHVFYTIQFFHGGSKGKFQVIRDVSPHHLKFDNDQD